MKKQSFLHGSVILIISALIAKLIGALFKIPLTNMLGGTGMGYFSSAYGLFLPIYAISVTGLTTAVAQQTAESSAFEQYKNARKIKKISLLMFSIMGLIGSIIIILLAKPFAFHVIQSNQSYISILMIAPSILFGCIMSVYRGYYEGLRNMYPTALSQVAEALVKLFAGLGLCYYVLANSEKIMPYFPDGTELIAVAAAFSVFGVTLSSVAGTLFLILRDLLKGDGISKAEINKDKTTYSRRDITRDLFKILIPVSIGSLVTNLTSLIDLSTIIRCFNWGIERHPEYFLEHFPISQQIGLEALSNFVYGSFTGLAVTVFNLVPSITNMFGKGVLPSVTESWSAKDMPALQKNAESVLMATGFIAIPSGFGICFLARQILNFLYPAHYDEILVSYPSLTYLGIGVILLSLSFPIFSMLQGIGRADLPVKLMLIGVVVKLIGNLVLIPIPQINVTGAGISTLICYAVILIISLVCFCKETKIKLNIKRIFLSPIYAGFLCGVTAILVWNFTSPFINERICLLISIAGGGIIYLFASFLLGVSHKHSFKFLH